MARLDEDEYVKRSYKFAHAETLEVGLIACLPEPPKPHDPSIQKKRSAWRLAHLYQAFVLVLAAYSVLYGLTARKARWLGGVTSAAVIILGFGLQSVDSKTGSCQQPSSSNQDATGSNRISCAGSIAANEPLNTLERSSTFASLTNKQTLDLNMALMFQERIHDPRFTSILRQNPEFVAWGGEHELMTLLQDKGLDPNFATMLKEKGLDPTILALLQQSRLDAGKDPGVNNDSIAGLKQSQLLILDETAGWAGESQKHACENWFKSVGAVAQLFVGTPKQAWVFFNVIFVVECVIVAVFRPTTVTIINGRHEQFEFGFSALLLSPVTCSILAFLRSLQAENMVLTRKVRKFGLIAWLLNTGVGGVLNALDLVKNDGLYTVRILANLIQPQHKLVLASVKAEQGNLIGVGYLPIGDCNYPRPQVFPKDLVFETLIVEKGNHQAPRLGPKFEEFVPLRVGEKLVEGEEGVQVVVEKTFW